MKKRVAVLISAVLFCSAAASSAGAYDLYAESKYAAALEDYPGSLSALYSELKDAIVLSGEKSDEADESDTSDESDITDENDAVSEPAPDTAVIYGELLSLAQEYHLAVRGCGVELSYKLMDYDVLLKRLKIALSRYDRRLARVAELELLAKTGNASQSDLSAANDDAATVYYDIQAILFEISALKTEIESITGERLRDTFDFERVYLITDVLKLGTLSDNVTLGTICVPEGAESAALPKRDISADMNIAAEAYYGLGTALRELISAEVEVNNAEELQRLGQLTAAERNIVIEQREDKFLEAATAKATLSKALLALDISSGGGLVSGVSSGEAAVLEKTVPDNGTGLWLVKCTKSGVALSPVIYPDNIVEENDKSYSYAVFYNSKQIGSAVCGNDCALASVSYTEGVDTALVEFRKNGNVIRRYDIGIFTPYGKFLNN